MFFRLFLLSIVSASIVNSDLTLPFEHDFTQDALPFDQVTLDSSLLASPLDLTAPLFEAESPSTDDALTGFDLSDSSDLFGGDTLQIVDCSKSEIPSALGKSRVKRTDDGTSCPNRANTDDSAVPAVLFPQAFDPSQQSVTCWQLTLGVLPFAVVSSGDTADRIRDTTRKYTVTSTNHRYSPVTLYRATIIIGVASFYSPAGWQVYCCQYVRKLFVYAMGINCVGLWDLWDDDNSVGVPLNDFDIDTGFPPKG